MRCIDPTTSALTERPTPTARDGELLIRVHAAGVNRADLLQLAGHYPPPPGASDIPGLEVAGVVEKGAGQFSAGDEVIALLSGGGYAEYVAVPAAQCLPLPAGRSMPEGAALPEALATAWLNLMDIAGLREGERVLIHGGSGGVGSVAIQLAKHLGATVLTTAGSADKCAACRRLGADVAIDYHGDVPGAVAGATGGHGVDVILDVLGAGGLATNIDMLASDGRIVVIGMQQGARGEIDLGAMLSKRLTLKGSTLRALSADRKAEIVSAMRDAVPAIEPQVYASVPLGEIGRAHELMDEDATFGKVVLSVD